MNSRRILWVARCAVIILLSISVSACSSIFGSETVPEPIGIGRDRNELKRSPCACLEVPQNYSDWMTQAG